MSHIPVTRAPPAPLIAIVDDDQAIREALDDLLQSAGFRCLPFASAEDFLAHADLGGIACIVLDVQMPGLSGLDLLDCLNLAGGHPPIVFMTSYADEATRSRALAAGARAVLGKPVDGYILLDSLAASLTAVAGHG
ncbi:response regulator transcription factor [Azospirillum picis]|uniref:FixJ family two-component response regulator n=1 Tax=Azospirillum picis TaxID=488438 RepID=A0ABU0MMF4_9PROT|nr:response regulator [Azospirillum picis]MBP2300689.1 FixJ family two-component response regulator [Azospirillum picis]MDQ0534658.1 FixJ family two-component response regulator [Azospirillum picis]